MEEVYLEEHVDNELDAEEELDDSDGWGEYIEEEFGDSLDESENSENNKSS